MATISVPSSLQGKTYSVKIAGDTPTPEEQARIDAFVAQQDAQLAKFLPQSAAAAPPEEQGGVGTALGVGVDMLQQAYGSALEGAGSSFGLQSLRDYGKSVAEANAQQIQEATPSLTGYEDVNSIGSGLSYFGQTLAQQVPQLGVSLAGAGAGALAGSAVPVVGTALGAIAGGALANLPFFYGSNRERQKEADVEAGRPVEVDEGVAFLSAIPQATIDAVVDKMLVGKFLKPEMIGSGNILLRAVKGAGAGVAAEVPSEIGQQVIERAQAGLPLDSDDAIAEYAAIARDTAILGGTIGSVSNVASGDVRIKKKEEEEKEAARQIAEDQADDAQDILSKIGLGKKSMEAPAVEVGQEAEVEAPVAGLLPPPVIGQAPTVGQQAQPEGRPSPVAAGQATTTAKEEIAAVPGVQPRPTPTFRWQQYQSTLQEIAKTKAVTIPAIQKAAKATGLGQVTPAVAKDIRAQMERDGVIKASPKARGGYAYQPDVTPQVDRAESYRRTLEDIARDAEDARMAREKAVQAARTAQQTGKPAEYRKQMLEVDKADQAIATAQRTTQEIQARMPMAAREQAVPTVQAPRSPVDQGKAAVPITQAPPAIQSAAVSDRSKRLRQAMSYYQGQVRQKGLELRRLKADQKKVQLPKSEIKRIGELEKSIAEANYYAQQIGQRLAAPAADIEADAAQQKAAVAKEAAAVAERAARTPAYTAKEGQVFTALRKRLDNLGLKDVNLVAEKMLKPELADQGALVEGVFDVQQGNRLIAVSMGIYEPDMSSQEMFDAISGVMNHEVIHAMRNLGLFTDAEWKVLSDLAARQQYMKQKNGKVVQRGYTYLQRAKQMYADSSPEIQVEEAVAEMFRDYAAGRLKIGGRPKTLMDRIKAFFQSMWKAHEDVGFTDANQIFDGVRFGEIGKRERKPVDADMERQSRVAAERAPSDPDFRKWASGPNGERVITDADGKPKVYYTGTSKDQDFTKFKVDKHGGWFTTDPNEASSYAVENDSMGFRRDGWDMKRVNTASRVMPVFLRAANPFTGPKPESVLLQSNYKKAQTDWFDSLRRKGYDAWMPEDAPSLAVMLNDPSQVKSVFARGADGKGDMRRYSIQALPDGVAAEEEVRDPKDIVMPIDPNAPVDEIKAQIKAMTDENVPIIRRLLAEVDAEFGTKSNDSVKDPDKVIQKATRPSILHRKPWHTVAHIRDTYRFQTQIDDFRQAPAIFKKLLDAGVTIVKIDTNKLFDPTEWGWRIIAFDLRMPNGQLVEYQLPLKEMLKQKKAAGHDIYEEWRGKTQAELIAQQDEYLSAIARSYEGYNNAFFGAMERLGMTPQEAEAAWRSAESSLLDAARNSRRSSGVMTSSSVSNRGFQTPSSVRMEREPSSRNKMALGEPSSTSANVLGMGGTSNESVSQGSVQDNLTPDQLDQVRYSIAMVVRKPEPGMDVLLRAPVNGRDGKPSLHYGTIFEGSRPIGVIFPKGSQNEDAKAGVGMEHVVARGHDKELFENSKYKSVEQAVYDIMYLWAKQGHKDGESVVSSQYAGNLTLDWVRNRTHSAPPLRLVLARYDAKGYPVYAVKTFFPVLEQQKRSPLRYSALTVPEGTRAHNLPDILLSDGDGSKARYPITQAYLPSNVAKNNTAIDIAFEENPNALKSEGGWSKLMQSTFGGEYLPKAPFVAIDYASNPQMIAEKLNNLTPALKAGVDRGFQHVTVLRDLYRNGLAEPDMTADLFIWGILSRGAGPVQQEGAYIDVIDAAKPFVDKAVAGPLSDADIDLWKVQVTGALREASPGRQVTMNVNAAGRLLQAMSQIAPDSDKTVLQTVHDMMSDPNISGPEIRRWFLSNTESAGIDNKVVSFILLVGGRDDVLVMDRIQSRHLWDDGRFGGANIYDGVGPDNGGLSKIMKGPRGLLVTEALENGLKDSVIKAYDLIGRPNDGSLGRFHWESWVIEGEQVVDHSTLAAVANRTPIGYSVTEGKMATFSSGSRYIRTKDGSVMEYPLSNGSFVYMKPVTFKNFLESIKSGKIIGADGKAVLDADGKPMKIGSPVIPKNFKVTERADIPWYERPEVDRSALDALAKRYEDAKSEGEVYGRNAGAGAGTPAAGSGSTRFSRAVVGRDSGDRSGREAVRGLAPLEGAPQVRGASGPDMRLVRVAEDYARSIGIDLRRQAYYAKVDPDRAARIAAAYDAMPHAPNDPKVKEAYDNLIKQTTAQYRALEDAGYKFWFMDPENLGEYASSPWNAMRDLRANQSMGVYPTIGGFGTDETADISGNPLLAETGIMWPWGGPDGKKVPVLANDLFRAVHDAFGHGLEGAGFRADGEENAWQAHVRLFTGSAKGAITSETRGQNSWLNYGPYGEKNRNAKVEDTVFADQKTGLMPDWTWNEGLVPDAAPYPTERQSIRYSVSPLTPQVRQKVQSNQKTLMYARASDAIAKVLNLKGYGLEERKAREFTDGLLRRFQDSMLPVGRMIQELSQRGLTITDAMDPYLQEELMHGIVGEKIGVNQKTLFEPVLQAVKDLNVPQSKIDALVKISDANSKSGKGYVGLALQDAGSPKLALAEAYLYAKHARERNRFIKANRDQTNEFGSGMTDAEANAILQWFESLDGANKLAVQNMAKGVRAIVANTNQTRLEAGLLSDEVVDTEEGNAVAGANYKFYVPLRGKIGEDADDEFRGPPGSPRYGARGREDRKALGRFDYGTDILANLFAQNQNAILRGERNKVGQSFLKLLRADPRTTSEYAQILAKPPTMRVSIDGKMRDAPDPRAYREPDILVVKENGKEVFVRFRDERLAGALNGQNGNSAANANVLVQAMQKVNRYLANINTSYNPEFFITNMFRDLQTAGVNVNQYEQDGITKDVLGGLKGALLGIRRVIRKEDDTSEWSKVYKDFMAAGGQNATNQFNSLAEEMSNIQTMLGNISDAGARGQWNRVKNSFVGKGVGSMLQLVEDYNTIVENGVRVATYKALLDRGFTKQRAAQAARNVTVNFAKGGDYRQAMGAWYLFYNASLQGSFALLNAAVRSKRVRKLWASVVVMGLLQDQLNAMLSDDDEDGEKVYDKIPDYILEHNFILPDPFGFTDRSYISIPMPYGLNMAHNIGRAMSRAARGGYDPAEATTTIFGTMVDTLNPIGGFESWANLFAPTVVDPFIDVIENRDFADKPIYKEGLPFDRTPAPDSQQYWATTSPSAVWLAKTLNELTGGNEVRAGLIDWSPDIMEFWFDQVTGGVGRFAQNTFETPMSVISDGFSEEVFRSVPFGRKLVGSVSDREDMGSYIEGASRVMTAAEELKRAREVGDAQWARETMQQYGAELRLVGPIKSMEAALRKISTMKNKIEDNPNMPEQQKRLMLEKLDERKQEILQRANMLLNQLE